VNRLCHASGVSRAGYYRFLLRGQAGPADMDLRSKIQNIALHWPAYGYRRVHRELLRCGWTVNHKRVLRLMRMDNLLCLQTKIYSDHRLAARTADLSQSSQGHGADRHQVGQGTFTPQAVEHVRHTKKAALFRAAHWRNPPGRRETLH
jgi:hypothetical protein